MVASSYIDQLPLWALFILAALIALVSIESGWQFGNYRHKYAPQEEKAPINAAVGATLGLLAFLLAFTFSMAGTRYESRKQNVLQEANAIGTAYLRADFLTEEARDEARNLLRKYTALRAGGVSSYMTLEGMAKAAELQDRLWAIAVEAERSSDTVSTGLFVQTLNEMIDLDATRIAAIRNRIPDTIWLMLFVVTIFSMIAMGYEIGLTGIRSWPGTILLVIVFTTVITLIADLDRPQQGFIQISQQPLIDLLNRISSSMP
jgi:hypothetical protein